MKPVSLIALLVSAGYAFAVPLEDAGGAFLVGSPVSFNSTGPSVGLTARDLSDREAAGRQRQQRTTNVGMNPALPNRAAAAASATQTLDVTGMTYLDAMLKAHNLHRPNHTESNLAWSTALASTAQKIASSCVYQHNTQVDGGGYGQNIGAGAKGNAAAALVNNLMYNGEINHYPQPYGNNNPDMSNFEAWGHYSQIVWAATTSVGCATVYCPGGLQNAAGVSPYFTVCNYKPPGNFGGQYSNVRQPRGGATYVIVGS